jgi:pimeloyl-ACP methyl ester carboxylesterase
MRKNLLFLPGLLCDAALWQHQIKALEGDFNISVADLTQHDSMTNLAKGVLAAVPERFYLAGLSMGGYVALEIMRQAPQRVEKLALLDTSARADTDETRRKRRGLIDLAKRGEFKGVTPRLLPMLISEAHLQNKDITQTIMDMAARVGKEAFLRQQAAILSRFDSRPYLGAIAVPTVVICGDVDALTPPEHAQEMHEGIKGSTLSMIKDSGHLSTLEQPQAVNAVLKNWAG